MRLRRHLRLQRRLQRRRKNTRTTDGGDLGAEVARLRSESHGDVAIFGSSDLTVTLLEQGLVDELRILLRHRPSPSDRATNDHDDTNARTRPATTGPLATWPDHDTGRNRFCTERCDAATVRRSFFYREGEEESVLNRMYRWAIKSPVRGGASRKWREAAGRAGSFIFSAPGNISLPV
ncbi:dihydrofolate reductase family protein [Streptomyces sp. B15]|nr:dihydrofolate reductase family protein [Streptomyces sp. B15]